MRARGTRAFRTRLRSIGSGSVRSFVHHIGNLLMEPYMPIWPGSRVKPLWNPISSAPLDHALEVQVADGFGCYALKFPCRLTKSGWVNAETNTALAVEPIAWRPRANRR